MHKTQRRITTIMFTDIFGYSKLMSKNEQFALNFLKAPDRISQMVIAQWK